MKKNFYFIILLQLFSCKTDSNSEKKVEVITYEQAKEINELDNKTKYVIAKSGLNYRIKPKGKIIGKLEFGKEVGIVENTNVFEKIIDEGKEIEGEWVGIVTKNKLDVTYVFDGFLATKKEFKLIDDDFTNFVPSGYEVEYKTEGDLNGDKIKDVAIVVKRKVNFKGSREVIILLKDENIFKIDKISKTAFPSKYYSDTSESYESSYDIETITISNNELIIELYGVGVVGSNVSKFKYFGKKLLLTEIENYANGAGGNYKANYDVVNGKIITEVTNLMREDTPTETTIKHVEKREFAFENSNPRNVSF